MSSLDSKFTRNDVDTLIEAMGDWESLGNQEFHVLNMVKNAPMPPEDHEAHEYMAQLKDHFKRREKEIKDNRVTRQEQAVFLKAKLMLIRRDMAVEQLFEMATTGPADMAAPAPVEAPQPTVEATNGNGSHKPKSASRRKLELAEEFIKDLGVWAHYEKFLAERAE